MTTTDQNQLRTLLWEAANILRGSAVDRTDWKGYILPLLFFKRISDVWDEETAEATEVYGKANPTLFPEIHRFDVPEGCHWRDAREVAANVGTLLSRSMQEIERANPDTLDRVFGTADWGNREKFTDELLKDLIDAFSAIPLGNNAVNTDILGDAYEYLVGRFADVTRRNKAGEFYTPRSVVRMMVELLDPQEGESIYDPACGTGGFLVGVLEYLMRTYSSSELIETHKDGSKSYPGDLLEKHLDHIKTNMLYGYDFDVTMLRIAYMNLLLHSDGTPNINYCDTLSSGFTEHFPETSTGVFDIVLANPPFQGSIDFESINPLLLR